MVASSSAFMRTTSLPSAKASSTTCVAYSTAPVASTITSTWFARQRSIGSVVMAVAPRGDCGVERLHGVDRHRLAARVAHDVRRPAPVGGRPLPPARMPGTLLTIWFARPWAMKPAPTMPTRIGVPAASSSRSAASTRIIGVSAIVIRRRSSALDLGRAGGHARSLSDMSPTGSGHAMPRSGSSIAQPAFELGGIELPHQVARLRGVLERLVAVAQTAAARTASAHWRRSARPRRARGTSGSPGGGRR